MHKSHSHYFMKSELYRAAKDASEVFPCLDYSDWLSVIHHLNAHEVSVFPERRGTLLRCLKDNDISFFCLDVIKSFLWENSTLDENFDEKSLFQESEKPLMRKAQKFYSYLLKNYQVVDVGRDGKERWKVVNVRPRS